MTPTRPGVKTRAGMMPTRQWAAGVMTPGQLGPRRRLGLRARADLTVIMSWTGRPSVMQMTRGISAVRFSTMASAAPGAGTKMMLTLGWVRATASSAVSKTGMLRKVSPLLKEGWTPATKVVP